jgi:hypothetical protein
MIGPGAFCHSRWGSALAFLVYHPEPAKDLLLAFFVIPEGDLHLPFLFVILGLRRICFWPFFVIPAGNLHLPFLFVILSLRRICFWPFLSFPQGICFTRTTSDPAFASRYPEASASGLIARPQNPALASR